MRNKKKKITCEIHIQMSDEKQTEEEIELTNIRERNRQIWLIDKSEKQIPD